MEQECSKNGAENLAEKTKQSISPKCGYRFGEVHVSMVTADFDYESDSLFLTVYLHKHFNISIFHYLSVR